MNLYIPKMLVHQKKKKKEGEKVCKVHHGESVAIVKFSKIERHRKPIHPPTLPSIHPLTTHSSVHPPLHISIHPSIYLSIHSCSHLSGVICLQWRGQLSRRKVGSQSLEPPLSTLSSHPRQFSFLLSRLLQHTYFRFLL